MKYYKPKPDEWMLATNGDKIACCDCGLTHRYEYRIIKDRIYWRCRPDKRATAAMRRKKRVAV